MSVRPTPSPDRNSPWRSRRPPPRVPAQYLALFMLIYAVQGLVFAYFIAFNQGYMKEAGVAEETISTVQVIALMPFMVKFLAGPLSDRFNLLGLGNRKPYIVLGLTVQSLGLVGLTWIHPGLYLAGFTTMAVLTVTGLALYDTVCDGLVVDITPPVDRPRVQGLLMGARFGAATVAALAYGPWLEQTGTGPGQGDGVLWTCAAAGLVPLSLALILPEPARAADAERFQWAALRVLTRPRSLILLAFGAFYAVVAYGVEINMSLYYDYMGFGQANVGHFTASRNLGRALGSLLLPLAAPVLGRRGVLRMGILGLVAATAAQALVRDVPSASVLGFCFGMANGWTDALFYVLAMEASDPRMAASTYALFMAVSNLSITGGWFFTQVRLAFDSAYPPTFLVGAVVTAFALVLVRPLSQLAPKLDEPEAAHASVV